MEKWQTQEWQTKVRKCPWRICITRTTETTILDLNSKAEFINLNRPACIFLYPCVAVNPPIFAIFASLLTREKRKKYFSCTVRSFILLAYGLDGPVGATSPDVQPIADYVYRMFMPTCSQVQVATLKIIESNTWRANPFCMTGDSVLVNKTCLALQYKTCSFYMEDESMPLILHGIVQPLRFPSLSGWYESTMQFFH